MDLPASGESNNVGATPSKQDSPSAAQAGPSQPRDDPDEPKIEGIPNEQHEGNSKICEILAWDSPNVRRAFYVKHEILMKTIPVLGNLFGKGKRRIKLDGFRIQVVGGMLDFLHNGQIDKDLVRAHPFELLNMCLVFNYKALKDHCESILISSFDVKNVVFIFAYAHILDCNELKLEAAKFINTNKQEVIKTKCFLEIAEKYPVLVVYLYMLPQND